MLMSVNQFTQQLGGLRQSFTSDYADKAKKDSLAILQAGEPNMREGGEKAETGLGAVAGMAKLGDSLGKVREKAMKAKGAINKARTAISDARNVASGSATQDKSLTKKPTDSAGGVSEATDANAGKSINIANDTTKLEPNISKGTTSLGDALDASAKRSNIRIGTKGVAKPVDDDLFGKSNGGALQDLRNARQKGTGLLDSLDSRMGNVRSKVKMVGMGDDARSASLGSKMNVRGSLTGSGDNAGNDMLGKLGSTLKQRVGATLKGANAPTASNAHAPNMGDNFLDTKPISIGGAGGTEDSIGSKIAGGVRSMVGDDVANTASRVAGVAGKGLEAGASVLDALGPIGDILGIGMAIFGGIEQHREKKEAMESSQSAEAQVKNSSAPTTKGLVASTNVSLDTSKQQGVSVASHY